MKISRRFLARVVGSETPAAQSLADILTGRGLEVESCERVANAEGIVVGKVLQAGAHPNADKLKLCAVDIGGGEAKSIVCGAPNVEGGMTVAVAPPGARVGGVKLSARKIRGVESNGMICSARELGVGEDEAGILPLEDEHKAGADAGDILFLNDDVLDVGITPNRGDCLSHLGIAREVCASENLPLPQPQVKHAPDIKETFPVTIDAPQACPFYGCVVLRGADCSRPSPVWMQTLLERCGMRAINAVVDVTNYIALLWGQPLHAFDLDKLSGGIRVRFAEEGERILLLDGVERKLAADDLVIADHKVAAAMGGVMGGLQSGVGEGTKNILLEAASFAPEVVRGRTRRHQITSEAAFRFERGVDPALPPLALAEAARLIKMFCGGEAGAVHSSGEGMKARDEIVVESDAMRGLLGMPEIADEDAAKMLRAMGIDAQIKNKSLHARPPSWRFDLHLPADIGEEVARAWGYGRVAETAPLARWRAPSLPSRRFSSSRARGFFAARGFCEVVSYAFVPREWEAQFGGEHKPVELQNPISEEMAVMRTQLFAGLMSAARFNAHHRQERAALFEIGRCFYPPPPGAKGENGDAPLPLQPQCLGGLIWGAAAPLQWHGNRAGDFYDLKGALEDFLRDTGALFEPLEDEAKTPRVYHPRRAVAIVLHGEHIGTAGECHPRLADAWDFRAPPVLFELDFDSLRRVAAPLRVREVARLPLVWRDVAMLAPAQAAVGGLLEAARAAARAPVTGVDLFDCYAGDNIPAGKKSFAVRITLQGSKSNLTDKDINKAVERVCAALEGAGARRREAQ